jgi:hypothetical protein
MKSCSHVLQCWDCRRELCDWGTRRLKNRTTSRRCNTAPAEKTVVESQRSCRSGNICLVSAVHREDLCCHCNHPVNLWIYTLEIRALHLDSFPSQRNKGSSTRGLPDLAVPN